MCSRGRKTPSSRSTQNDLLLNDYNPQSETVAAVDPTNVIEGTIEAPLFTFTPTPNFAGTGGFEYKVMSSKGLLGTAVASIEFTPLPDLPVAGDDIAALEPGDVSETISVGVNDFDPDDPGNPYSFIITSVTQGSQGTVTFSATDVTYTPTGNLVGSDTFTYTITDADGDTDTATVTIVEVDEEFGDIVGNDVYYLRLDGAGVNVQVFDNDTAAGVPIFTNPLGSLTASPSTRRLARTV